VESRRQNDEGEEPPKPLKLSSKGEEKLWGILDAKHENWTDSGAT